MKLPFSSILAVLLAAMAVVLAGCNDSTNLSADEEAKVKKSIEMGDKPFDINNVPPEHRDKVRGFMPGGGQGAQGTTPPPPSADSPPSGAPR